eukprot:TRINITY_DN9314_c0_g7_i1.p1 TRINITY_DN9314_c0_g7~~TRINITY_DN9314_c0_g7_i1.p1  ORF type:complete len:240 (+),score=22.49 TRINITY_DN9314_c0_g7_i1:57-776(+)
MKIYDVIEGRAEKLIKESKMFFVSSAPKHGKFINLSPKGLDATLKITGERQVMYLDSHGSGCETLSHIRENGRICLMWCAFKGDPCIVRIHGMGRAVLQGTPDFNAIVKKHFSEGTGPLDPKKCRSIIVVDGFQVMDSCGYAVPFMTYEKQRTRMPEYLETNLVGIDMDDFNTKKWTARGYSLDGLPSAGVDANCPGTFWRPTRISVTVQNWIASNYQGIFVGVAAAAIYSNRNRLVGA